MKLRLLFSAIAPIVALSTNAAASPPPPPPAYVVEVANLLTQTEDATTISDIADFIADDVTVFVNDKLVADGKLDWMRHYASRQFQAGGLLAYSESWKNGGNLMIVDQFDTVDRSSLPAGSIADPRYATRATLYEFAVDGKIHAIRAVTADGFWIKP